MHRPRLTEIGINGAGNYFDFCLYTHTPVLRVCVNEREERGRAWAIRCAIPIVLLLSIMYLYMHYITYNMVCFSLNNISNRPTNITVRCNTWVGLLGLLVCTPPPVLCATHQREEIWPHRLEFCARAVKHSSLSSKYILWSKLILYSQLNSSFSSMHFLFVMVSFICRRSWFCHGCLSVCSLLYSTLNSLPLEEMHS